MIDGQPVSLLISSRNRPKLLIDAVQSVLDGLMLPDEIVVVDQSDVRNELLAALPMPDTVSFQYIKSDTTGISRSRNIAFEHASHAIVVVIDDDCIVAKDWLEVIVRALLAVGPKAVITGRVLAGEPEEEGAFAPSLHTSDAPAEFCGRITTDPLATFNFALHATTYAAISAVRFSDWSRYALPLLRGQRLRLSAAAGGLHHCVRARRPRLPPIMANPGQLPRGPVRLRTGPGCLLRQAPGCVRLVHALEVRPRLEASRQANAGRR